MEIATVNEMNNARADVLARVPVLPTLDALPMGEAAQLTQLCRNLLALAIEFGDVRAQVIEWQGGCSWVEATPEQGTVFKSTVPQTKGADHA